MTDHTAALTYSDALRIARGCTDYGGGYRGDAALFEAYQHGIQTVITALTHADPKDSQTRALMAMGAQPQQPAGFIHPDNLPRLKAGETVAFRKKPYDGEECIPVYVGVPAHPSQQQDDELDAKRYRWLRDKWGYIEDEYDGYDQDKMLRIYKADEDHGWDVDPESLDAAIDAAMSDSAGEGGKNG